MKSIRFTSPLKVFVVSLLLAIHSQPALSLTSNEGKNVELSGDFSVSGGQARYSLPISVSPGRAGHQPSLSFEYRSDSPNGMLGMGWSLGGVSSVSRCGKNLHKDGLWGGVNFDSNDRYCIDGQRLIAISGQDGENLTEYRVENNGYAKIVSLGRAGKGPASFKVWHKDGSLYEYGVTEDSRVQLPTQEDVYKWSLNKIIDTSKANHINFVYSEDNSEGKHKLVQVNYIGGKINFVYEARPDSTSRYFGGELLKRTERLKQLDTFDSAGRKIGTYGLTYQQSSTTERTQLTNINYCVDDQCSTDIQFLWTTGNVSDYEWGKPEAGQYTSTARLGEALDKLYDVERDGLFETYGLYQAKNLTVRNCGSMPRSSGWIHRYPSGQLSKLVGSDNGLIGSENAPSLGFSGLAPEQVGGQECRQGRYHYIGVKNKPKNLDFYNNGQGNFVRYKSYLYVSGDFNGDGKVTLTKKSLSKNEIITYVADFNNDGKDDRLVQKTYKGKVSRRIILSSVPLEVNLSFIEKDSSSLKFIDLNNDGLLDVVFVNSAKKIVYYYFDGKQFRKGGESKPNELFGEFYDVDRDGYPEMIVRSKEDPSRSVALKNRFGTLTFEQLPTNTIELNSKYLHGVYSGRKDLNSDGIYDLLYTSPKKTNYSKGKIVLSKSKEVDRIVSIHQFSVDYDINYKHLADRNVHTQERYYKNNIKNVTPTKYVVAEVIKKPRGYSDTKYGYHYQGAKLHTKGGGFLGFKTITETEMADVVTTTKTSFEQEKLEIAGKPLVVEVSKNGKKVSETHYKYKQYAHQGVNAKYYQVYAEEIVKNRFGLNSSDVVERKETITRVMDRFGNLLGETSVTSSEIIGVGEFTNTTKFDYLYSENSESYWKNSAAISQVSMVKDHRTGLTRRISNTFSYNTKGFLATSILHSSNYEQTSTTADGDKSITNRYRYDQWGNLVSQSIEGTDLAPRTTTTQYDSQGLYVTWSTNALGHRSYTRFNNQGLLTQTIGTLKSRTSSFKYDAFGRVTSETLPGKGNTNLTQYQLGAMCGSYTISQTVSCVTTKPASGGQVTTHFDYAGREIRKLHTGFSGQLVVVDTRWDRNGRKLSVTRPQFVNNKSAAPLVTFAYDALNRQIKKQEPANGGGVATFVTTYDGYKTSVKDARGFVHRTETNVMGHILRKDEPHGAHQTYQYYPDGKLKASKDSAGNTTQIRYDNLGHRSYLDDPDMGKWSYTYNAAGELIYKRDAKGIVTTIEYDRLGRKTKQTEGGKVSTWRFDERGAVGTLSGFSGNGSATDYYYNDSGLTEEVAVEVKGEKFSSYYFYDQYERVAREVRPNGIDTTLGGTAKLLTDTNNENRLAVEYVYNPHGYVSAVRSPKTYADEVFSSARFRKGIKQLLDQAIAQAAEYLTKAERYSTQESFFTSKAAEYNSKTINVHNLDSSSQALLGDSDRYKQWCTNQGECYLRPATWMILHGDVSVPIEITLEGAIYRLSTTLANSSSTIRSYDATLHKVSEREFKSQALTPSHDFILTDYDRNGQKDLISKDNIYVATADGTTKTELLFAASDLSQAATIANTNYKFYADLANQLIELSEKVAELSGLYCEYANQLAGNQLEANQRENCSNTQQTSQAEHLSLILTQSQLEDSIDNPAYVYYWQRRETDAYDHTLSETLGNGLVNTYAHDRYTGRPSYITTHKGDSLFDSRISGSANKGQNMRFIHYRYDKHNNVSYRYDERLGITDRWTYDGLDRVKTNQVTLTEKGKHGANNPDFLSHYTYNYDALGNLQFKTGVGRYEYSKKNAGPHAVTKANGLNYQYDANGNMLRTWTEGSSSSERQLEWTEFNKPNKITRNGKTVEFFYDANHNRYMKKNSEGIETFYFGKAYERVKDINTGEVQHKHFIYADGKLIALNTQTDEPDKSLKNKQIRYLHYDALNSVDMITDGYGLVVERRSYDTWGKQRKVTWREEGPLDVVQQTITNRGYTGHEEIVEVGLVHMNGRVYDQELGRFISPDPFIQSPYVSNSFNRYAYVINNPLKYTDPNGYWFTDENGNGATGTCNVDGTSNGSIVNNGDNGSSDKSSSDKTRENIQGGSVKFALEYNARRFGQIFGGEGNTAADQVKMAAIAAANRCMRGKCGERDQRAIGSAIDDPNVSLSNSTWKRLAYLVTKPLKKGDLEYLASNIPTVSYGLPRVVATRSVVYGLFEPEFSIPMPVYKQWNLVLDVAFPGTTPFSSKYPLGASLSAEGNIRWMSYGTEMVREETIVEFRRNVYYSPVDWDYDGQPNYIPSSSEHVKYETYDVPISSQKVWKEFNTTPTTVYFPLPGR